MTILLSNGLCHAAEKTNAKIESSVVQWNFENIANGNLPAGAHVLKGKWFVRAEQGAPSAPNALCQDGVSDYPAILLGDKTYSDLKISTSFKPISGKEDQAAGIIFRVQDKDNYYILRANALENNVNIYKYVAGWRKVINEGSAKVSTGIWQELRVEVKGSQLRGFLNGKMVVEATDNSFKSGKIGLWTKADSVTCFDNVQATTIMK